MKNLFFLTKRMPIFFLLCLILQISFVNLNFYDAPTQIKSLPSPPSTTILEIMSMGDNISLSKILTLWLQNTDIQKGQFLSYDQLNYDKLTDWLTVILKQDPAAQYPLFLSSQLYTRVRSEAKQRQMLTFVYTQFLENPSERWQWLAYATVLAKHRLHDLPLALQYASAITDHATPTMPAWAQEMHIFILEDLEEWEQAQQIIGGILAKGYITDDNEISFLNEKLKQLSENKNK